MIRTLVYLLDRGSTRTLIDKITSGLQKNAPIMRSKRYLLSSGAVSNVVFALYRGMCYLRDFGGFVAAQSIM